jgi:hypothetical protein
MGWQPIETAPKDAMQTVMLYTPEGCQLGFWLERAGLFVTCEGENLWAEPTHWWDFGDGQTMPHPPTGDT